MDSRSAADLLTDGHITQQSEFRQIEAFRRWMGSNIFQYDPYLLIFDETVQLIFNYELN